MKGVTMKWIEVVRFQISFKSRTSSFPDVRCEMQSDIRGNTQVFDLNN